MIFNRQMETNLGPLLFNSSSEIDNVWEQFKDEGRSFMIGNMADIVHKFHKWSKEMPRVEPFYAVKSNPDPLILRILASLGVGFDCASKTEIESVLSLGVSASRIIFASTCKFASHLRAAREAGVRLTTFDSEHELRKISQHHPNAELVIRIISDEKHAKCSMARKFGCELEEVPHLLKVAKELQLNIVGVSFHVGMNYDNPMVFENTIASCKKVFAISESIGYDMSLLDLGGGFPGRQINERQYLEMARVVRESLSEHFPPETGVRIIAEPGKFFSDAVFTLYTRIIAKREKGNHAMYFMNDGLYGSFRFATSHSIELHPRPLLEYSSTRPVRPSSLFGPTCDSDDKILDNVLLPDMNIGEWIAFDDMGAYAHAGATNFNGFEKPRSVYVFPIELKCHFDNGCTKEDLCIMLKEHILEKLEEI